MSFNKTKRAIQKSVKKATNRQPKPSKEKHVKAIVLRSFNKSADNSTEEIIRALSKRLEKTNWAIVLKALMIFHRAFKDGDPSLIESMKPRSATIFSLRNFNVSAPANHLYTIFVTKYAKYLEEKVSVVRLLGYQFEKNKDAVKNLKTPKCFKIVPKLQSQLNALLNCKMKSQYVGSNQLIHRTYLLLMKDSLPLYSMLNDAVLQLLDMFWKMEKKYAAKVLTIYKLFCKETDALISLYEIGKAFVRELPAINKAETSIIESMEKYVDGLADSDSDSDPKNKKKNKKASSESESGAELKDRDDEEYDNKDFYDKDKDSDDDDESSSGEDDQPEDNYFTDFFKGQSPILNPVQPVNFQNQFSAPSFGPGAHVMMSAPTGDVSYHQKANLIKSIANSEFSTAPYATNPSHFNNNPFGNTAVQPFQANPFGANPNQGVSANPFANNSTNPFGGTTAIPHNNSSIFAQNNGGNMFGNQGNNNNVFGNQGTNVSVNPFAANTNVAFNSSVPFNNNNNPSQNNWGNNQAQQQQTNFNPFL